MAMRQKKLSWASRRKSGFFVAMHNLGASGTMTSLSFFVSDGISVQAAQASPQLAARHPHPWRRDRGASAPPLENGDHDRPAARATAGHLHRHIATKPVNSAVRHPKRHRISHRLIKPIFLPRFPVKLSHIPPICTKRGLQASNAVEQIILAVIFCPNTIERTVIGHPIQYDTHAHFMCCRGQSPQVIVRAIIRIDGIIILHAVWTPQRTAPWLNDVVVGVFATFSVHLPNGVNRHQPKNVHSKIFQTRQVRNERLDGSFWSVLAQVDLVDGGILRPKRMNQFI